MSPHLHRPSLVARVPLRAARWSATHPWRAIGTWFVFVAVAVALAALVPTKQTTDADYRLGESGRADAMTAAGHFADDQVESVLITSRDGGRPDPGAVAQVAHQLQADLAGVHGVTHVTPPQWNAGRTAALVDVHLKSTIDDAQQIQARTAQIARAHAELRVREAGEVSVDAAINDRVAEDLHSAEGISLPITILLMLLAFGALIAAGVPVLLAITSVAATMGIAAPMSHLVHAEPTVNSLIVLIGMAVGVDYSLFYLKREREERAKGNTTRDAVEIAAATSGHSILVSGAAVIASMAGLFIAGSATFASLASGAIVVVAVAVVGSVTVLPALLVKLGRWVDRPRLPLLWRVNRRLNRRLGQGGISRRILAPVVRRPVAALVASLVALVALAAPALGMRLHDANLDTLPASIPQVQTLHEIADEFPTEGATATVVVHGTPAQHDQIVRAMHDLERSAVATRAFDPAGSDAVETAPDGETVRLTLPIPYSESDDRSGDAVQQLRDDLVPATFAGMDVQHAVGGDVAESLDFASQQSDRLPFVIGFVLLLTLVMMTLAFRSLVVAALSSALNLLSVGVSFGILTLVFQHGWFAGPLGFTSPGFVIDWLPLFVMVILVGLSMDYNVFVLARIREHTVRGLPPRLAVERGITDTAGVITSAAAVMVSVFAIFITLSMLEMKMMGVALAASILIDATLIRLVMLPAALVLLGRRAWWPGRVSQPHAETVSSAEPARVSPGPADEGWQDRAVTPDDGRARWVALVVCCSAMFMTLLDVSVTNVALPSISDSTGAGPSELQWIVSGYTLAFGLVPVLGGKLGDDHGRRVMFQVGVGGFAAASLLSGLAPTAGVLIGARVVQGLFGGLINPQVSGLVQQMFRGSERGRAFGFLGTTVGLGTAIGPLVGGVLIALGGTDFGWRLVFFINIPIGLVVMLLARRLLPAPTESVRHQLDVVGALLLGGATFCVLFACVQYDALRDVRLAWLGVPALALLVLFYRRERTMTEEQREPLVDFRLFRRPSYVAGITLALTFFPAMAGLPLVLAIFYQRGLGYTALQSALGVTAFAVGSAISAPLAGRVVTRVGRPLVVGGAVTFGIGAVALAVLAPHLPADHAALALAPALFVMGCGQGALITPNQTLALMDVDPLMGSTAGGVLQTSQRIGLAIGQAVIGAAFFTSLSGTGPDAYATALQHAVLAALCFITLAVAVGVHDLVRAGRRAARADTSSGRPKAGAP